jgi:hypothetical protein
MPFKPGQSGNPGGRPKYRLEFRERCRNFADKEGWAALEDIARTKNARDRMKALEMIFAYGYGKPTQPISGDPAEEAPPIEVTVVFDKPDAARGIS